MSEPVGIIHPPPDLRGIVDSTAKYVAKNGGAFEERIMREHKGKPKFSFLFPNDPFNAYYKHRVKELRNSFLNESRHPDSIDSSTKQARSQTNDDDDATNNNNKEHDDDHHHHHNHHHDHQHQSERTNDEGTGGGEGDRKDQYQQDEQHDEDSSGHRHADDRSHEGHHDDERQHDHGDLEDHDQDNEGNSRVKPKLYEYMQDITMKLEEPPHLNFLANPASFITHLESDIIKLTAQFIATYGRPFLLELASREQANHHFDFLKPQHGQFPYMTKLIMQYALTQNSPLDILEQLEKDSTSQRHILERIKMRAEWDKMLEVEKKKREEAEEKEKILYSQIDWHDFVIVETIDYQYNERGEYPPTTPDQVGTRLLQQQRKEDHSVPEEMEIDMDVESDQEGDGSDHDNDKPDADKFLVPDTPDIVIRRDYDPKAATKVVAQTENYFVSPITNERIPVDKIHEHVRYNLADPRYLEKKEQMLKDKIKEDAVFASGSQIQDSLKNLAERRTDIFGMNEEEAAIGRRIGEEEQEQSKDNNKLIWDGHKSSLKKKKLS